MAVFFLLLMVLHLSDTVTESEKKVGIYIYMYISEQVQIHASKKGADKRMSLDFPGDPVVKNLSAKAGNMGLICGPGRFHMPQGN